MELRIEAPKAPKSSQASPRLLFYIVRLHKGAGNPQLTNAAWSLQELLGGNIALLLWRASNTPASTINWRDLKSSGDANGNWNSKMLTRSAESAPLLRRQGQKSGNCGALCLWESCSCKMKCEQAQLAVCLLKNMLIRLQDYL